MYNSNIPSKSELPSTGKLITSTIIGNFMRIGASGAWGLVNLTIDG